MLIDWEFFQTVIRESAKGASLVRTPESALVMNEEVSVYAYERSGRSNGALSGTYLYHLAQMCELIKPGDVVLDLGCGPGNLLAQVARLNPRAEFIGIDLSSRMLELAEAKLKQHGITNVELRRADMTSLTEFDDRSLDVVVSSMALHHLPDLPALEKTFSEIGRVLRRDGAVYLNDFGRLKDRRSVDYFVSRAAAGEHPALVQDYVQSLHAAFSRAEFDEVATRHLHKRARVYSTIISPLVIVVKGGTPQADLIQKAELRKIYRSLPGPRKSDVRQMKMFLRLDGLRSAI